MIVMMIPYIIRIMCSGILDKLVSYSLLKSCLGHSEILKFLYFSKFASLKTSVGNNRG